MQLCVKSGMANQCVLTAQNSKTLVLGNSNPEFPACMAYAATLPDHESPVYFWDLMYLFDSFHHRRSKSALFINDLQCLAEEGEIQRHARTNRLGLWLLLKVKFCWVLVLFVHIQKQHPTCLFLSLCCVLP